MVDTLFQFGNIYQSLIVYLFINCPFYKYYVIVKQHTFQGISSYILKNRLFWLWTIKKKNPLSIICTNFIDILWLYSFHTNE